MSRVNISEEDLRDRVVSIVDVVGPDGQLDEDELQQVATEAWRLSGGAKQLHYERTRTGAGDE